MKFRSLFLTSTICLAVSALFLAGPATAQNCIPFKGISHCPLGNAALSLSSNGLSVQNQGTTAGVSSRFAPTVLWSADTVMPQGESEHTVMSSISGGETTSTLLFEPEGDGQYIRPTFTGSSTNPTYSLLVYRGGVLQKAIGGLYAGEGEPGSSVRTGPQKFRIVVFGIVVYDSHRRRNSFSIAQTGGCNWGLEFEQPVAIRMPDGDTVNGDRVVFAEEVSGPGHYPYLGFESIEISTSVSGFTITDELADGAS